MDCAPDKPDEYDILIRGHVRDSHGRDPRGLTDPPPPLTISEDGVWDDQLPAGVVATNEMEHELLEMIEEALNDHPGDAAPKRVSPMVLFQGKLMWKGFLTSTYNGSPQLSKDCLSRVRESFHYNNSTEDDQDGNRDSAVWVGVGSDYGVLFIEPVSVQSRITRGSIGESFSVQGSGPRGRSRATAKSGTRLGEQKRWYVGRVQRVNRKFGNNWGRARKPVNLLSPPPPCKNGECYVKLLFHYYTQQGGGVGRYKYDKVAYQWIDLGCVINVVRMTVHPDTPGIFHLNPDHMDVLNKAVAPDGTDDE